MKTIIHYYDKIKCQHIAVIATKETLKDVKWLYEDITIEIISTINVKSVDVFI